MQPLEDRALMAQLVWDGGGGNSNWSTAANWANDVAPAAGDDLVFPAGAAQLTNVNNLAVGTRFNTIQFQGGGYNITGSAIELAGGLTANNVTGTNNFGLNVTLINAQTIMNANTAAVLNLTGSIDTANILGNYFFGTIPAIVFDGAGLTNSTGAITGAGSISKMGTGTVVLGGNNTFEGLVEARQGFIRVTSNTGLGSATTSYTEVQAGAAVELSGVTTAESFVIREGGVGFGNGTDISSAGALRAVGGVTSTISGNVELQGGNNLIGVASGTTLNISGQVLEPLSAGNRRLLKVGSGTLQFTGSQPNTMTGDVVVLQGELQLGKTGAGADHAITGSLVIGDHIGGDNAARVRLIAPDQIAQLNPFDVAINTITINSSGQLLLNNNDDTIGNLTMFTGSTYSADVASGTGTMILGGNLTLSTFQGSSGATPAATISGNMSWGTIFSGGGAGGGLNYRVVSIADTQLPNIAADLNISANITGGAEVAVRKDGGGTLRLGGTNTFSSPFVMNGGIIEVGSNSAFGSGLLSLQNGGNVLKPVGVSRTISNAISLDGDVMFLGDENTVGVENLTFTGTTTLTGGRTLFTMDPTQTVTFAGSIGEGIFGSQTLNKSGRGTLNFTAANTYSGGTTVNADGGNLVLSGAGSILNVNGLQINLGSQLTIDNTGTVVSDRINDARSIGLQGRLLFRGNASADVTEFVGPLDTNTNTAPIIEIENVSAGAFASVLVANTLTIGGDRPTRFIGTGLPLSETGKNRFEVTFNPGGLDDGIIPQAVVVSETGQLDFGTYGNGANGFAIIALPAAAYVTDLSQATANSNVRLTANTVLPSNKTVNAILLDDGVTLSGPANSNLVVAAGNILFRGNGAITVASANVGNGIIQVPSGKTATISSNIYSGTIQKNGLGKLIISGDNQHTGNTLANEGTLNIQRSTAVGGPGAGTFARTNAIIELEQTTFGPINVGLEALQIDGTGGLANGGALRNVAGNNSWAGNVSLGANAVSMTDILGGFPVINSSVPFVYTAAGTTFTITGDFSGSAELAKIGPGTLELSGIISRGTDRNNRILEGTMLLNNVAGTNASRGRYFVGSDVVGAPAAILRLGASDQIIDDRRVEVFSSGLFDLNGNQELIAEGNLILHVGPGGAGDVTIGAGGVLTINADIQVHTIGSGNATGATITGGTLALQLFGVISTAGSRSFQINDGATGADLTISSSIVDGTGVQSVGINKNGFGTLTFSGTTANTYTGDTVINEGTLILNKGSGTGGVNALAGRIFVGDNNPQSGFSGSDILRLGQPNQIPDFLAPIDLRTTGRWELAGNNETIGLADAQNALTLRASSTVDLGGATLTLNGNINTNAAEGATLWTPVAPTYILNGTLAFGSLARTIDVPDRAELAWEIQITANITGTGGMIFSNSGTFLLEGNNSGLSGDVVRTNGNIAVGSDTALGTGRVLLQNGTHFVGYNGKRTLANEFVFQNETRFLGGNNTAGSGALGGGGNDLTFAGPVNIVAGNWFPEIAIAGQVEFAGGIGEIYGGVFTRKQGFGTLVLSSEVTLSGNLEIGQDTGGSPAFVRANGGLVLIKGNGTYLNSNMLIGVGGALELNNSGIVNNNRLNDAALIDMAGGILALTGKSGAASGEVMGQLRLRNNSSSSQVHSLLPSAPGSAITTRFSSYGIEGVNAGSSVKFVGRGTDITAAGTNRIAFTTIPTLSNGIINSAVMEGATGLDFAAITNPNMQVNPANNFLSALTGFATSLAGATTTGATSNVKLTSSEAVPGAITVNAVLLANGGIVVNGGGSLSINSGLLVSTGAGNSIDVGGVNLGGADSVIYTNSGDLTLGNISATGSTSSLSKGGRGMLVMTGNNLYTGVTRVTDGIYRAASNTAFGTTAGNVTVTFGSTLELFGGVNIAAEQVFVNGFGESNIAAVGFRSLNGTNTWNGIFQVDQNRTAVEVASGSRLILAGQLNSGNGLNKTGAGALEFQGGLDNATGAIIIWQGSLELNKSAGRAANGTITIGDNVGGANADKLIWLNSNQIQDSSNVDPNSSGLLDYGTFSDTFNAFTARAGVNSSATITGTTGVLTINANSVVDIIANSGGGGSAGPVTIAGNLNLAGTAPRILTVADTYALNDVNLSAVLSGVNFQKDGAGRMTILGNNSAYAGTITLNGGETVITNANALGSTGGTTTVNNGFTLLVDGTFTTAENIASINGGGFGGQGAIRQITGTSTWTGGMVLAGTATLTANQGATLDIQSAISGGANGITKILPGTLTFSGGAANTYTGTTSVFEGTLRLNKTAGTNAIAGVLTVGNDTGPQDSDLVILDQANQILDSVQVQVTPSGHLSLNGNNETLNNAAATGLNFFTGPATFPKVSTGAGTLTLGGSLGVQVQAAGNLGTQFITSPGATILGNLALGGNTVFTVVDTGLSIRELQIDATITGTAGFQRSNTGIMVVNGNNAGLSGAVTLQSGGGIVAGGTSSLGTGTITIPTNITTAIFATNYAGGAPVTQTIPNAITLNNNAATATTLQLRGDDNLVLSGAITNTLNNSVLTANMQANVAATLSGTINLTNDATGRTLNINNNTFGAGSLSNSVPTGALILSGQIVNGGAGTGALVKGGVGLAVLSNNTNSYTGLTTVNGGVLLVTANGALGTFGDITTNHTLVNNGFTLAVAPGVTLPEWILANNNGFGNFGSIRLLENSPGVTETATISGNVNFNATTFVGVDGGGANPDRLVFTGTLASGGGLTTKVGLGEAEFAGATDNSVAFTGAPSPFDDGIDIRQGTLYFNKTGTNRVLAGAAAITVGDGGGGNDTDRLIIIGSSTDHIIDTLTVNVGSSGKLSMAGASTTETITNLTMNTGRQASADVDTGTPVLTVSGTVTVNTFNVTDGTSPATVLAGNIVVGGAFAINDTFIPSASDDLSVTANFFYSYPAPSGGFYAGLREGRLNGAFDTTTPNPGTNVQLGIRAGQTPASPPWADNVTWVYTGEVFDADGIFSFAENIDDNVLILIDGVERLRHNTWNVPTSTGATTNGNLAPVGNITTNFGPGVGGWHTIEIRMGNGAGGAGPNAVTGWTTAFGLGFSASGSTGVNGTNDGFIAPQDPGNQTLFRTPAAGITPALATTVTKSGAGTLNVRSASAPVTGLTINGGTVAVSGGAALNSLTTLSLTNGGVLQLDNSTTVVADRIADSASITLTGGTISYIGNATNPATETLGAITLNALNNVANTISSTTLGNTNTLTTPSITRNGGASINFVGVGSDLGSASNQFLVTGGTNPFVNGVIPYATISGPAGFDLVTDGDGVSTSAPYSISRVTSYSNNINTLNGIVKLDGTEPAANRVLTGTNTVAALLLDGGVTVSGAFQLNVGTATSGLIVNRGGNNVISSATTTNLGGLEELFLVQGTSSLDLQGPLSGTNTLRKQGSGNLILSANNTGMTAAIQVHEGTLTARNSGSFGTTAGGVNVLTSTYPGIVTNTSLVLDGNLIIGNEQLDLAGSTSGAFGLILDTLRVINGSSTWGTGTTVVNLNGNGGNNANYINVGTAAQLILNASIGGGGNLVKYGAGELVYGGSAQNGNTQVVSVNEGTLRLAKTAGAGPIAIRSTLTINDLGNFDPIGAATVIYDATAAADQIGDVGININHNGTLDFNGKTDSTTGTITINGGSLINTAGGGSFQANALTMTGGLVDSGTGTFNLNGTLTYNSGMATGGPATISGNLNLLGATRTFTINDGYFVHNDLTVNAAISNGRIVKGGAGALLLTNAGNTFLAGINEVQRIVVAGATAGTSQFNVNFNGNVTSAITVNATDSVTAAALDAALEALPNVGPGGVNVTVTGAGQFDIEFTGHLGQQDVPNQITVNVVLAPGTYTPSTPTGGVAGINHTGGILAFNNNTALGTARIQIGNAQLLPVGGDRTIANDIALLNNVTTVFGGRRDFGGTDDLTLTGGVTLHSSVNTGQVVNIDVNDPLALVTMAGVISGGGNFIVPTKRGIGTLVWSANNTFDVRDTITGANGGTGQTDGIRVEGGILRLANSNALGSTVGTANVHVRTDVLNNLAAAVELDGSAGAVNLPVTRNLVFLYQDNYTAFGVFGRNSSATGVLRSLAGTNSVAGILDLRNINDNDNQGRIFIGVDAGTLQLPGTIIGTRNNANSDIRNNRDILKVGAGTLEFTGTGVNFITNNTAVLEGPMVLNKAPGVPALSGTLVVGDNIGAANSDTVVLAAAEQIPDGSAVVVTGSGRLQTSAAQATSLTNEVQQVQVGNAAPAGQFRLNFNGATTGDIAFGASTTTIQNALNALATIGGVGGSVLVLGGSAQNQSFTITFLGSLAGANQPQIKIVSGTTAYSGATLAVTTLTTGGVAGLETIGAPTLRMAPQATGNILLNAGSTLALNVDLTVDNYGALPAAAPTTATISGGTLALQRTSSAGAAVTRTFNVNADGPAADDLVITSTITDGAVAGMSNLAKSNGANSRFVLAGTAANTYTGTTTVNTGALQIEKAGALGAALPSEVQNYIINNVLGAATGQYSLTFDAASVNVDANATADEVQTLLNGMSTIGGVGGSVQVVSVINGNTNIQYFIRFGGTLAGTDVNQIAIANVSLSGASVGAAATSQGGGVANIAAAQTTVNGGGSLEVDIAGANTITNEQLTLNGTGIVNASLPAIWNNGIQTITGTGALRILAGDLTWEGNLTGAGNIVINNNPTTIRTETGTSLTIGTSAGVNVLAGGGSLLKSGPGLVEFGGVNNNTYTGNTYVNEGTLRLNKQGTAIAIPGGEIMVGDNVGVDNADQLTYAATAGGNQNNDRVVRIARTGFVNFNNISDTINNGIVLDVGPTISGDIATGAGLLTNNNQFTIVNQAGTSAASVPATFSGNYDLNGATRNIDVREGSAPVEFDLQATIQVTGAFGFTKIGQGRLRVSGSNSFTGAVTVNAGVLEVGNSFGLGTAAGGTTVANTAALEFKSAIPLFIPETTITVTGDGWNNSGLGVINSISPTDVTLQGTITIPTSSYQYNTTIGNHSAGTTLNLQGNTTISTGNLIFNGDGNINNSGNISAPNVLGAPYFSTLEGRIFQATGLGVDNISGGAGFGINNLVPGTAPITTPTATKNLVGPLYFPVDADGTFTSFFGVAPSAAAFTAVFWGTVTIPTAGNYYFAVTNNDDRATLWIDNGNGGGIANNNNFESGELRQNQGCCGSTGFVTVNFTSAGTFKIAYVVEDTGGNSGLIGRFQPIGAAPASGSVMPIASTTTAPFGNVTKNDAGSLILSGQNSFNATTVNQGAVYANNAVSALGVASEAVTVNNNAILGGVGTILGPVSVNSGGTLNPGPQGSVGQLTVNNNVNFASGSRFAVDINGTVAGAQYDQLRILGGTSTATIAPGALIDGTVGYTPANGVDKYTVIDKAAGVTISGTFTSQLAVVPPQTSPGVVNLSGKTFSTDYNSFTPPNNGFSLVLTAVASIRVWDGGDAGSNNWTLAPNWVGDNVTNAPVVGDSTLVFDNTGVGTRPNPNNNFPAGSTFTSIQLANTTGNYTLGGNSVNLTGGVIATNGFGTTDILNLPIGGAGGVSMTGGGTLILNGTQPFTGPLAVGGGTVLVNGSLTGTTAVNVTNGALGGTGTIQPLSTITATGGSISPGNPTTAIGTLTTGNVAISAGSTLSIQINGTGAGQADLLNVLGSVALGGNLSITLGYAPAIGDDILILANDGGDAITGTFGGLASGSIVPGTPYRIFYNAGTGNDVALKYIDTSKVYIDDDTWGAPRSMFEVIVDADPETPGNQTAFFGLTAFATINAGLPAVDVGGTVFINSGTYNESVNPVNTVTLRQLGFNSGTPSNVTIGSLAGGALATFDIGPTLANSLFVGSDNSSTIFNGVITGNGSGPLTKVGTGTLTLANANSSYLGTTNVNAGTLAVASIGNSGSNSTIGRNAVVNINGNSVFQYTGGGIATTNRTFNTSASSGANSPRIDVSNAAGDLQILGGTLNGVGQIFGKTGAGTLTFGTGSTIAMSGGTLYAAGGTTTLKGNSATTTNMIAVGANAAFINGGGGGTFNIQESATINTVTMRAGENNGGPAQTNIINQSGGIVTVTGNAGENDGIRLGHWGNETSTYNLSNGTLQLTDPAADVALATDGVATFNQTGGNLIAPGIWVNHRNATGTASLNLTGGTATIGARGITVAASTTAVIGGTANVNTSSIQVGTFATSSLVIQGNANVITSSIQIGNVGNGSVLIQGSSTVNAGIVRQGAGTAVSGDLTLATTVPVTMSGLVIGRGTTTINGSTVNNSGLTNVGTNRNGDIPLLTDNSNVTGTLNVQAGALNTPGIVSGNTNGGGTAIGIINHSGGTVTTSGDAGEGNGVRLGHWPTGNSTYNLSGTGILNINGGFALSTATDGTGAFVQTGGTANVTQIDVNSRANGQGSGTFVLNGGIFNLGSGGLVKDAVGAEPAIVNLGGGTFRATANWNSALNINLTNAVGNAIFDTNGFNINLNGPLSGAGGLTKIGAGILTFTGTNTYGGNTNVQVGTLRVNGSNSGPFTVQNGGTLGGDGSIGGTVTVNNGGILAPGGSPGDLATGSLNLTAGANYNVEINGVTPITQYDQTSVTGTVTLTGSILNAAISFAPAFGQVFVLIKNDSTDPVVGMFANANAEMALVSFGGLSYHVTYVYNSDGTANDVALIRNNPPTADAGSYTIGEGDDLQLDGSGSSDPDGDVLTYRWDVDGDGDFDENITGQSPLVSWATLQSLGIDDGPETRTIYVEVNDGGAPPVISTGTLNFQIDNTPPTAGIIGPSFVDPGDTVNFTFTATDPSAMDTAAGFTYEIDWNGDSIVDQTFTGAPGSIVVPHTFLGVGVFPVTVVATDKNGDSSVPVTLVVQVTPVYQDLAGNVIANGLNGEADRIVFSPASGGRVQVRWENSISLGKFAPLVFGPFTVPSGAKLIANGKGGDDTITNSFAAPVVFDGAAGNDYLAGYTFGDTLIGGDGNDRILGGAGNDFIDAGNNNDSVDAGADDDTVLGGAGVDTLNAGTGNDVMDGGDDNDTMNGQQGQDVLFGGNGNDTINGYTDGDVIIGGAGDDSLIGDVGRDILLGGSGKDTVAGGGDDDIVAGGITAYDSYSAANASAVKSLLAEWNSGNPYLTRITNLKNGTGLAAGKRLNPGAALGGTITVVNDDGFNDTIKGETGTDWFLASTAASGANKDTTDRITGESLN